LGNNTGTTATLADHSNGTCQPNGGGDTVFTFTAAVAGDLVLRLESDTDQGLTLRSTCAPAGVEVLCQDRAGPGFPESAVLPNLTAGQTVFVFVGAHSAAAQGAFVLDASLRPVLAAGAACDPDAVLNRCGGTLACAPAAGGTFACDDPQNDLTMACANEVAHTGTAPLTGTTAATRDLAQPLCAFNAAGGDVFIQRRVTSAVPVDLRVVLTSATDHALSVRSACADAASEVACRDLAPGTQEVVVIRNAASMSLHHIVVSAIRPQDQGPFTVEIFEDPIATVGQPCVDARCGTGLTCSALAVCVAAVAPVLTGADAYKVNLDGTPRAEEFRFVLDGSDMDADVDAYEVAFKNAAGQPVDVLFEDANGNRSSLGSTFAFGFAAPSAMFTDSVQSVTGVGGVLNQDQLASADITLLDAAGSRSNTRNAQFTALTATPAGGTCSTTSPTSVCAFNSTCVGTTCQNPATMACASPPVAVTGQTGNAGTTTGAADLTPTSCSEQGGQDVFFRYAVQAPNADVFFVLRSDTDQGLSVRTACANASSETHCQDVAGGGADEELSLFGVAGSPTLNVVVSAYNPTQTGDFTLFVFERAVVGAGATCDPTSMANRCAQGLLCNSSSICAAGTAPTLSDAQMRATDTNGNGLFNALTLTVDGGDVEGDVFRALVTVLDAAGNQLELIIRNGDGVPANLGSLFAVDLPTAEGQATFTDLSAPVYISGVMDLEGILNQNRVDSFEVVLQDRTGLLSIPRLVPLTSTPVVLNGAACDPAGMANICAAGNTCNAVAGGMFRCQTPQDVLTAACQGSTTLANGTAATGTTVAAADHIAATCQGAEPTAGDVFFRYTVGAAETDLTVSLQSATDQGFTVLLDCALPEVVCVDTFAAGVEEAIGFTAVPAGTVVTIVVHPFAATEAGPFTLTVTEVAANVCAGPEGTTSVATPQVIAPPAACNGTWIVQPASIDVVGDMDFYQVALTAGQTLTVETFSAAPGECASGLDTIVDIRLAPQASEPTASTCGASDASRLACNDDNVGGCSLLVFTATTAGNYLVRVVEFGNNAAIPAYGVSFRITTVNQVTEVEPNDDGAPATGGPNGGTGMLGGNDFSLTNVPQTFSSDTIVQAAIGVAGDEDVFQIVNSGAAAQAVRFTVSETADGLCPDADTLLELRDASGVVWLARNDDFGGTGCSELTYSIPAGAAVFAHVWDYGDFDVVTTYFLRITFL